MKINIADKKQIDFLFKQKFNHIIHFAAESHVDRSIAQSDAFIDSNIVGTHRLIEKARQTGIEKFIHISTDEVYGDFPVGTASEQMKLNPRNPYSASKASSELLCASFYHTYHFPVVITRCTNNYGPNQHPEKLIPRALYHFMKEQPISIYGDGSQERDWLYVLDHCKAIDVIRLNGKIGEIYNIGAEHPIPNIEVVKSILNIMDKPESLIEYVPDRPGHDARYSLDTKKIRTELGWKPTVSFEQGLKETVEWYLYHKNWWEKVAK